ncbi:hypothetical protein MUB15_02795 [Priestia sp. OVS21]|nr:hypothetical protein [Priestia sp. OVS21]
MPNLNDNKFKRFSLRVKSKESLKRNMRLSLTLIVQKAKRKNNNKKGLQSAEARL